MLPTLILGAFAAPVQSPTVATVGRYQIELRVPEEGLFAGESVDVEFRLSDKTQKDPIEGFRGVPNATVTAAVTMPAMPGMPVARPNVHREGVPGDYGLELFFPHGGDYKIALRLTPPGAKPIFAVFNVGVKDSTTRKPRPAPYRVELIDPPKKAGATRLRLAIKESKTGATVKAFDVAHEKTIHLMLMSKDLGWFAHEHPMQLSDGSFVWNGRFPAGGDYLVFADVAPKNKGSQVLGTRLRLAGAAPAARPLVRSKTAKAGGVEAVLEGGAYPVGETTPLAFRLKSGGKPVTDLQPYLGAWGHLMIVHRDGATFVHSHPSEAKPTNGRVVFDARFPRAGTYKAWAQFQRGGRVVTLPFVFEVGSSK